MTVPDGPDWINPALGRATHTKLFQDFLPTASTTSLSVKGYATVSIVLGNIDGTSKLIGAYAFKDSASGFTSDSGILSCYATSANPDWPSWIIPVETDTLLLRGVPGNSTIAIVVGHSDNHARRLAKDGSIGRRFQAVIPAASPVGSYALPGVDANLLNAIPNINASNINGSMHAVFGASQAISADLQLIYYDVDGTVVTESVGLTLAASLLTSADLAHPFAYVAWNARLTAVSPASPTTLVLQLTASQASV